MKRRVRLVRSEPSEGTVDPLVRALESPHLRAADVEARIGELREERRGRARAAVIDTLCHLRFDAAEASRHWTESLDHLRWMEERLGVAIDLRVGLFSYFMQVDRQFKSPRIVEARVFEETRSSAYLDELTGLRNHRGFSECLTRELGRAKQEQTVLSLVMVDVDHFKAHNDRYGHEAGNRALAGIARRLEESTRRVDTVARYGGEEFALILPTTPKAGAERVAERARRAVGSLPLADDRGRPLAALTISLGVATYPADAEDTAGLVQRADSALYDAKSRGRDRVCLYRDTARSHRRVEAALPARISVAGGAPVPGATRCVGEGGLRLVTSIEPPAGALADLALILPDSAEVCGAGRILGVKPEADGFDVTVRFVEMGWTDRRRLSLFVRSVA